jgi:uncharacterized membrane protein YeaQ/YmgE (transglycosylase-associated protein family)
MEFVVFLILLAVWGLFVGAFARLALPGKDPLTIPQTIAIGLAGSFIAGLIGYLLFGERAGGGFLMSLVVTVGILYVIRRKRGGGLVSPGAHDPRR